jgi:hypothetical protein
MIHYYRVMHRVLTITKVLISIVLGIVLTAGTLPIEALFSSSLCSMACCSGMAPHSSGSCMGGSCHIQFSFKSKQKEIEEADPLCGIERVANRLSLVKLLFNSIDNDLYSLNRFHSNRDSHTDHKIPSLINHSIVKPCSPDCGASASSFFNQRQTYSANQFYTGWPRPPTISLNLYYQDRSLDKSQTVFKPSLPRAPPIYIL